MIATASAPTNRITSNAFARRSLPCSGVLVAARDTAVGGCMTPDVRNPIRFRTTGLGTTVSALLAAGSTVTGTLVGLEAMELATWINALILVVVGIVVAFVVMWVLRSGTTLTADHLRLDDAIGSRSVPWRSIEAIAADSGVAILVDGEWLPLNTAPDLETQVRTIAAWWTARRGGSWRPPTTVPPTPAEVRARQHLEDEAAKRNTLRGWWAAPGMVTGMLGAPISLALASAIGLSGAVTTIGSMFVALGAISVVAKLVSIVRAGVAVRAVEVALALVVLGAVAVATLVLRSVLPA